MLYYVLLCVCSVGDELWMMFVKYLLVWLWTWKVLKEDKGIFVFFMELTSLYCFVNSIFSVNFKDFKFIAVLKINMFWFYFFIVFLRGWRWACFTCLKLIMDTNSSDKLIVAVLCLGIGMFHGYIICCKFTFAWRVKLRFSFKKKIFLT